MKQLHHHQDEALLSVFMEAAMVQFSLNNRSSFCITQVFGGAICVCVVGIVSALLFALSRSVCGISAIFRLGRSRSVVRYLCNFFSDISIYDMFMKCLQIILLFLFWSIGLLLSLAQNNQTRLVRLEISTDVTMRVKYVNMLCSVDWWVHCSQRLGCKFR